MWYPVAGTTVPYLRNCGTRLLEQWCNSGRNLHLTTMNQIHRIKELNLKSCENAKNSLEKVTNFTKTPLKKLFNSFILST